MDRIKNFLRRPVNWLFILGGISLLFGILFRIFDVHWLYVAAIIPWGPIALYITIGIIFAWIVNPIRLLIMWLKSRTEDDND